MSMVFTALSPNTQKDDAWLALKLLFSPSRYFEGGFDEKEKGWFRDFFQVKYAVTFESARTALYFILKSLGLGEGDTIALQAFTCVAASNPIKWVGAKPLFLDIDPKTYNIDIDEVINKTNGTVRAIIVQHTFGYPAEIEKIVEYAKSKNIRIIEDCTHTIGTEFEGKKLGTFGDAAIFSFGRDKAISASFGGIAITNDVDLGKKLEKSREFLQYPSKKWVKKQILYTIVAYLTAKYYNFLSIGKLIHFIFTKAGLLLRATSQEEKKSGDLPDHAKSKLPNAFAQIALNQLKKIDKINQKRQEFSKIYKIKLCNLNNDKIICPEWKILDKFYPLRFPLRVKNRNELLKFSEKQGVLLGDWYTLPVAPEGVDVIAAGYMQGSCPNAEESCREVVNLPMHINMTKDDALKVVAIIKKFYKISNN